MIRCREGVERGGGGDEKRRYIPMRSAAAMMMRNDDILTRRGGKNGEDRLESLSLLPPSCCTGCLTSKKSDKGSPHRVSLKCTPLPPPLSLRISLCVTHCIFWSLSTCCVHKELFISLAHDLRSLEGVICVFAADFSLTFFHAFFSPAVNWIAVRVHCCLTKLALCYRK